MKKLFVLVALLTTVYTFQANAQGGGDPAARMQAMKERMRPQLVEKTKITSEQADKVIDVSFAQQRQRRDIRMDQSISEEEKTKRLGELDAARDKELKAFGITDDQLKSINAFYEEMRKEQMQRRQNGGGGGR